MIRSFASCESALAISTIWRCPMLSDSTTVSGENDTPSSSSNCCVRRRISATIDQDAGLARFTAEKNIGADIRGSPQGSVPGG